MESVAGKTPEEKDTPSPAPRKVEFVIEQRPVTPQSRAKFEARLAKLTASINAREAAHAAD